MEVINAVFVSGWDHDLVPQLGEVSAYGRLKMQCLCLAGTTTQCPLRIATTGVHKRRFDCISLLGMSHPVRGITPRVYFNMENL